MIALAELLLLLLIAAAAGRTLLFYLRLEPESGPERLLYGATIGLGILAYATLALGLLGLLRPGPVTVALLAISLISARGWSGMWKDAASGREPPARQPIVTPGFASQSFTPRWIRITGGLVLAAAAAIVVINCFTPPATDEWDALSYHLAAPKVYLEAGRIVYLPTDHHSNFPFTMQMLFLIGLMFNGFALANLIHFATAALTVAGILILCRKWLNPTIGWLAAIVFATCPMAVWESGAAYVEVGFALFVLTAVGMLVEYRKSGETKWLHLSAILIGLALSVKTLALIPLGLMAGSLLTNRPSLRKAAAFSGIAILVGCPFYVKSWIVTGKPVYPFGYRIFGGRDWSPALAETYASEHRSFGQSGQRVSVAEEINGGQPAYKAPTTGQRILNVVQAPFDLVATPRLFHNFNNPGIHAHLGYLVTALPPLLLFTRGASSVSKLLAAFCALWFLLWSQSMQYARYLLPMVPLLAIPAGDGSFQCARGSRLMTFLLAATLGFQAALTLSYFGSKLPDRLEIATHPGAREKYLTARVNVYAAEQWVNQRAARNEGVVLFEETRGFYLDRPYLWGNGPHSRYIPYDRFANGREMADWFLKKGYRYAILNLQFSPYGQSEERNRQAADASLAGTQAGLVRDWYADGRRLADIHAAYANSDGKQSPVDAYRDIYWRLLLGDAVENGGAVVLPEASSRGAVVLEFKSG